ncbi:N-acetylneuraminate synthase [SAR202 cluster bacterium AD-802-F09_MRT_200m]|nr:N-acetylneuraminate synthase [SAR202 cluster bacterium AD-802-F09_MRT_200m]
MLVAVDIGNRRVGLDSPCFIIAEAGVNHNGSLEMGFELIDAAAEAGADAVKFQTFKAENLVTSLAPKAEYQLRTTDAAESQYEMIRRLELSPEMHRALIDHCNQRNILFLSSFFDEESADLLQDLGVPAFKMPSGEITNLPLLAHVARKGKPMIVSTGMADMDEVAAAVHALREEGNREIILLQCVSNYPADPADVNLRAMNTMAAAFGLPVGYSDHTNGIEVAVAAVALGACVIEKHFTLDRNLPGPDHTASLEPDGLAALVRGIRTVESALGHGRKEPALSEANTAEVARKSLVAARDIPAGAVLTEDLIAVKRPGTGLPPLMRPQLAGRTVRVPIPEGTILQLDMLT